MRTPFITAPMPVPALPGSLTSPSMLAYVIRQKYVDSLPLYRQEQQFRQLGIELSRQIMANWLIAASERWLARLYDALHAKLLEQDIAHADETTLQVLKEPGRSAQAKSCLWLYRTGRVGIDIVLYDYRTGRGGEHPEKFLTGFRGICKRMVTAATPRSKALHNWATGRMRAGNSTRRYKRSSPMPTNSPYYPVRAVWRSRFLGQPCA